METSIDIFKGLSPQEIEGKIIDMFQEHEEITIVELKATYGCYMESIEACKEDVASYFVQTAEGSTIAEDPESGYVSIACFEGVAPDKFNKTLEKIWGDKNTLTIIELGETYTNNPISNEKLKNDVLFYFSVKEDSKKEDTPKLIGAGAIRFLLYLSVLGLICCIIAIFYGFVELGILGAFECLLSVFLFNYILDLGEIAENQEKRIKRLEKQLWQ